MRHLARGDNVGNRRKLVASVVEEPRNEAPDSHIPDASAPGPSTHEVPTPVTGPVQTPASGRAFGGALYNLPSSLAHIGRGSFGLSFGNPAPSATPGNTTGIGEMGTRATDEEGPARRNAAGSEEDNSPGALAHKRVTQRCQDTVKPIRQPAGSGDEGLGGYYSETISTPRYGTKSIRIEPVAETKQRMVADKHEQDCRERVQAENKRIQEESAKIEQEAESEWAAYKKQRELEREKEDKEARLEFEVRMSGE
ncbi:hypothetical protein BDV93DRAFT_566231 [Ceratobasidium sp. AG-I]|nr:hypothetical protein BDV93DRAFT_566231 [Ceratobasidium sp. AG-I]